jgi:6-pyruvoyltetrahydropterin/6-carboxytetrahydropterin synthase
MQLTTIELYKEEMKFNAGHFTIFSQTEREHLHGHQFTVQAFITAEVGEDGITFDYSIYKKKIITLCKQLNEIFLIAGNSPYLSISHENPYVYIRFNEETIPFLESDILILPVRNVTVEELSRWFLNQLTEDEGELAKHHIHDITIKVLSCPGQSGSALWKKQLCPTH